ncbi:MAG: amidohydrolase [Deltaproteobacteria bacterium]|nr:amidohydrolase [Deltaproteobacteria bacterium]
MRTMQILFLSLATLWGCASTSETKEEVPVVNKGKQTIYNGSFVTQDENMPQARALLVDDESGTILEVFEKRVVRSELVPVHHPIVDLDAALIVPGLHDAHAHIEGVGKALEQVDLRGCTSPQEIRERISLFLERHPDVASVQGRGWDQSLFPGLAFPTASILDGLSDKFILVRRVDGHAALANHVLLDAMGLTKESPEVDGGRFLRDESGIPTGVLVDNAMDAAFKELPPPSVSDHKRWLLLGMKEAQKFGLTAVHDMGMGLETFAALKELDSEQELPVRVFVYLYGEEKGALKAVLDEEDGRRYQMLGLKFLMDGAMGSRGAALLAPYDDEPGTQGLLTADEEKLKATLVALDAANKQLAVHAIGDQANRLLLDVIESAQPKSSNVRHRVEHAQLVHADDFARFQKLKVIASMQPTHATSDMRWVFRRVGEERAKGAYAWRTMLDHHVPLAFGSDAPVESIDVRKGLFAATTRQNASGDPPGGWMAQQTLSATEALAAFSTGGAYAAHQEKTLGRFVKGAFFDATLFAEDVREDPKKWLDVKINGTFVGGRYQQYPHPIPLAKTNAAESK